MDMFLLFKIIAGGYMALLAAAALFDACKFVIPNWISLALVGLFVGAGLVYPPGIDWLSHLGAMGLVLLGTLLLYRFRFLGGGDLKLLVAAGLWAGLGQLPQLLIWTAIAGGVFALGLIVLRRLLTGALVAQSAFEQVALPRFLLPGEQIPYGVAIAAGGIWLARDMPLLHLFL